MGSLVENTRTHRRNRLYELLAVVSVVLSGLLTYGITLAGAHPVWIFSLGMAAIFFIYGWWMVQIIYSPPAKGPKMLFRGMIERCLR